MVQMIRFFHSEQFDIYNHRPKKYVTQQGGCISKHTGAIDKSGVPKEAQDNALSDGIGADCQIPPQRPQYCENFDIYRP
jgi:hypothetical protein